MIFGEKFQDRSLAMKYLTEMLWSLHGLLSEIYKFK